MSKLFQLDAGPYQHVATSIHSCVAELFARLHRALWKYHSTMLRHGNKATTSKSNRKNSFCCFDGHACGHTSRCSVQIEAYVEDLKRAGVEDMLTQVSDKNLKYPDYYLMRFHVRFSWTTQKILPEIHSQIGSTCRWSSS